MSQPSSLPTILISGDSAVTIEFGRSIDAAVNARVLGLDEALAAAALPYVIETVPTYRSLIVHYDPVCAELLAIAAKAGAAAASTRHWRIPVVYGGDFGLDLDHVAGVAGVAAEEVIAIHSAAVYRVYMIGFTPGYSYLGGLDPRIVTPRRKDPRLETPAGTVAIGGEQTGVQCLAAPSGWNLIGRTPVRTFHPSREPMFLLEPGDSVSFTPIEAKHWDSLDRAAAAGEILAELLTS
ncbi:MAG: 5-oxoprolinase subunit PxpB [Beijerinckiaceae bacterium]|nr:5-oxoprolinase subunit PxpB [Beijerinckiaceae bacterium]